MSNPFELSVMCQQGHDHSKPWVVCIHVCDTVDDPRPVHTARRVDDPQIAGEVLCEKCRRALDRGWLKRYVPLRLACESCVLERWSELLNHPKPGRLHLVEPSGEELSVDSKPEVSRLVAMCCWDERRGQRIVYGLRPQTARELAASLVQHADHLEEVHEGADRSSRNRS